MDYTSNQSKRSPENVEAWILGSGIASLAAAVYLVKKAKVHPSRVHVLDEHLSLEHIMHHKGDATWGYEQFPGCLPVPIGSYLEELLAMVPSARAHGISILEEIQIAQAKRFPAKRSEVTCFVVQKNSSSFKHMSAKSLGLSYKDRVHLIQLLLKREQKLQKRQIQEFFSKSFFGSSFWTIWSIQ